ncbi:MAG: CAP domain-containing protein [Acidimicrobiia bacterium]
MWFVGAAMAVAVVAAACLPPGATSQADHDGVINMINDKRAANGQGALVADGQLDYIAQNWSGQLAAAGHLAHQDLYGLITSPFMPGWQRLTENVFQGGPSSTNALVVDAWMASSGHRDNIVDPNVNRVGVGVTRDGNGTTFVVADFGLR